MLDEGVVAAPEDIDLAMITGAGFSFWNGGLTMLLDIAGISEKVNGKRSTSAPEDTGPRSSPLQAGGRGLVVQAMPP